MRVSFFFKFLFAALWEVNQSEQNVPGSGVGVGGREEDMGLGEWVRGLMHIAMAIRQSERYSEQEGEWAVGVGGG